MKNQNKPKREAYKEDELSKIPCAHCGKKSSEQWNATLCANARRTDWKALCRRCDIKLNEIVLKFLNFPNAAELIKAYRAKSTES